MEILTVDEYWGSITPDVIDAESEEEYIVQKAEIVLKKGIYMHITVEVDSVFHIFVRR